MGLREKWRGLSLSRKLFIGIFGLLGAVVGLVEGILVPLVEYYLSDVPGAYSDWYEFWLWIVSIVVPSVGGAYLLSQFISRRLGILARGAESIAGGNLQARFTTTGNRNDAYDAVMASFNRMAESLERLLHNERRLLADISHELRSPLARMQIAVALLERGGLDDGEARDLTLRLEKEISRMGDLVAALLARGKESLEGETAVESVDIGALLEELAADFSFQARAMRKSVSRAVTGALPPIRGKRVLLQRLFGNLLSNALFYAPVDSGVELGAAVTDDTIIVTIRDFGPGVPEAQLEDIFRAFYRVDSSRTRASGGIGLGLAMAKEAALLHGGTITARNARPGLAVTVRLPVSAPGEDYSLSA